MNNFETEKECVRSILSTLEEFDKRKAGKVETTIYIGEVGDEITNANGRFLKSLTEDGILSDLSFSDETSSELEEFEDLGTSQDNHHLQNASFSIDVKKFKNYLVKYSFTPRFFIEVNQSTDEVTLNQDYSLGKPQDGNWTYHFWKLLVAHPNKHLSGGVIDGYFKKAMGQDFDFSDKRIKHALGNYKLTGALQRLFFPVASNKGLRFRNPVFQSDVDTLGISEKQIELSLKKIQS